MADFSKAIQVILKHEGGFVDHKSDPGGATNYGVSLRLLKKLGDYGDIDCDGDVDVDDIKSLTEEKSKEVYKRVFWDANHYDEIEDDRVATKVFDIAVNAGPATAARVIQKSTNVLHMEDLIKVDGNLGPKSFAAINACDSHDLLMKMVGFQKTYYTSLCDKNPNLSAFLKGWLHRAEQI